MATATMKAPAPGGLSNKARELMEAINAEAGKHNVWVRTQANAPAQRPWFSQTDGAGSGQLASGRVAVAQMKTAPHMWRWKEYSPYLHQISEIASKADVSPIEFADRQSILLLNPGLNGRLQVTNTIRCAISIYNPGDVAPVHLHSPNASRTILSDKGGYTVVEGERCTADRGDLILTPNGTWHDHGNDSSEPVIWIDTLDWPLMEFLDAAWVDHDMPGAQGNTNVQPVTFSEGYSRKLYGQGGIKPAFVNHQRGVGHAPAPLFHYRGADVKETLHSLRKEKGDPHEGIKVDFVNPVTGEPVFKTLNYSAQLLRPGEETELLRGDRGHRRDRGRRQALRVEPQRPVRGAELPVAASHQHRQDRRGDLLGVGRRADEEHRPVLRAGPRQGRQGHRAGELSVGHLLTMPRPERPALRPFCLTRRGCRRRARASFLLARGDRPVQHQIQDVVRKRRLERGGDLVAEQAFETPEIELFRLLVVERHELRYRNPGLGNDHALALGSLIHQLRELGLGFGEIDLLHGDPFGFRKPYGGRPTLVNPRVSGWKASRGPATRDRRACSPHGA
jgi:gentisate 1,2-dioxygenase